MADAWGHNTWERGSFGRTHFAATQDAVIEFFSSSRVNSRTFSNPNWNGLIARIGRGFHLANIEPLLRGISRCTITSRWRLLPLSQQLVSLTLMVDRFLGMRCSMCGWHLGRIRASSPDGGMKLGTPRRGPNSALGFESVTLGPCHR